MMPSFRCRSSIALVRLAFWSGCLFAGAALTARAATPGAQPELAFIVAGDMRSFTENTKPDGKRFFDGACEAMKRVGPGAFSKVNTAGDRAWVEIYRADPTGVDYQLRKSVELN